MRAMVLAMAMNMKAVDPLDLFRFLNVPAIVLTLRAPKGRVCRDVHTAHARRRVTARRL